MGVETLHPAYTDMSPEWAQMRDCMRGERRIKAQGVKYLPKSQGQAAAEKLIVQAGLPITTGPYEASKAMARFIELLESAVVGFAGIATRVPWSIAGLPASLEYLMTNAGGGLPLEGWQAKTIAECLITGRYGLLPDAPAEGGRARIQWYPAESLTNWKVDDEALPNMATLRERVPTATADEFSHDTETRYRVIRLEGRRARVTTATERGVETESGLLDLDGMFPLVVGGVNENGMAVERPPLSGLAESLLSYYRLSASHRWAIRQTCDPTLLALGFSPGEIQGIGAGMVIEKDVEPSKASLRYIEIQGTGLSHVKDEMDAELERAYGQTHRLSDRSGIEASDTIRQRAQSKTAGLRNIDKNAAASLQEALNHICRMNRLPPEVTVESAADYTEEDIEATALTALVQAVGLEQLPARIVRDYVRKRGLLEDLSDEDVVELIQTEQNKRAAEAVGLAEEEPLVEVEVEQDAA